MNRNRHLLFLSAALIAPAVLCAHAARAQDVAAPDQSPASAPETAALPGPQNAEAAQDEGLSDIVVTATRREERLQDVPVSVTAIDSASLDRANISSTANLIQAIPALTITRNTSTANPAIRGIVSNGVSVGDEPNVGFYVDGVYQPVSTANIFDLAGVERVEVLRGPQGTLFGRNSMGGLINVITRDPTQDTEGELRVSAGRFSEFSGRGYISGGLAENVAGSLSLSGSRNSGFSRDLVRGGKVADQKALIARGKLVIRPSSNAKITGSVFYSYNRDDAVAAAQPINGNTAGRLIDPNVIIPSRPNEFAGDTLPLLSAKKFSANLLGEFDLGGAVLNTASSYQYDALNQRQDNDGTTAFVRTSSQKQISDSFSQEVRLSSDSSGPLTWIVGGYYFYFKGRGDPIQIFRPGRVQTLEPGVTTESEAIFAEGTYAFTDRLSVTVGGRYTWEDRTFEQTVDGAKLFDTKKSYQDFTPRGIIKYEITPATNVYASISTGFKSGVFGATSTNPTPVEPEKLVAYEVGLKSDPLRWLRFNTSAFYYDYTDLQASARGADGLVILRNAAQARIYGGEMEILAAATPELNIRLSGSYIHGRYTSFPGAVFFVPNAGGGNSQVIGDASGNRIIRSPTLSGTLAADYTHEFDSGILRLSGSLYHSSRIFYDFSERTSQDPYTVLNATVAWTLPDQNMTFSIWGNNLFNAHYVSSINVGSDADLFYYQKPVTYGVSLEVKF